ncbi:MAG: type IV-A pilus assembly ATPase PilB, partial [Gammaproteobacteria bacterium]|nr:type IV-A pilus assembly ATPase PilB [Gammaproteobacteria bacterium]
MTNGKNTFVLTGLARRFVEDGLLEEQVAREAYTHASNARIPLITYLVQNGLGDSRKLAVSAAMEFGIPVLDLTAFMPE